MNTNFACFGRAFIRWMRSEYGRRAMLCLWDILFLKPPMIRFIVICGLHYFIEAFYIHIKFIPGWARVPCWGSIGIEHSTPARPLNNALSPSMLHFQPISAMRAGRDAYLSRRKLMRWRVICFLAEARIAIQRCYLSFSTRHEDLRRLQAWGRICYWQVSKIDMICRYGGQGYLRV